MTGLVRSEVLRLRSRKIVWTLAILAVCGIALASIAEAFLGRGALSGSGQQVPEFEVQIGRVRTVFQAAARDRDAFRKAVLVAQKIGQEAREVRLRRVQFKSRAQLALDRRGVAGCTQQPA